MVSPLQRATETGLLAFEHLTRDDTRVRILAHDGCREGFFSRNICDLRRNKKDIEAEFPLIDYSNVAVSPDGPHGLENETVESIVDRAYEFCCWLRQQVQEDDHLSVAVATHSVFLLALTTGVFHFEDASDPRAGYFQTGEMRTYQIRVEPAEGTNPDRQQGHWVFDEIHVALQSKLLAVGEGGEVG